MGEERVAPVAAGVTQLPCGRDAVHIAVGAHAAISFEYLLSQVRGLGAQLPLVHAIVRTERKPASRDFQRTPTAKSPAIRSSRDRLTINPTSLDEARSAHYCFLNALRTTMFHLSTKGNKEMQPWCRAIQLEPGVT